jgi:hypothetical protein
MLFATTSPMFLPISKLLLPLPVRVEQFLGYEFLNSEYEDPEPGMPIGDYSPIEYRYFISDDGLLQIYRNQQLLTSEQGTWQD